MLRSGNTPFRIGRKQGIRNADSGKLFSISALFFNKLKVIPWGFTEKQVPLTLCVEKLA